MCMLGHVMVCYVMLCQIIVCYTIVHSITSAAPRCSSAASWGRPASLHRGDLHDRSSGPWSRPGGDDDFISVICFLNFETPYHKNNIAVRQKEHVHYTKPIV